MIKSLSKKRIASLTVFVIGILLVLFYIVSKQRVEFDSDYTDTILWADAMLTGNGLFDTTMNYAYTLPFGGSLLMAPFVAIFGVGFKAHALGFVLFLTIFVYAGYKFFRAMDFSADASLACMGLILLLSLPTKNVRMIMWGHVIHYSLGLLFVVIALAIYGKIDTDKTALYSKFRVKASDEGVVDAASIAESQKSSIKWMVTLAIFTALACTNGLTTILFFAMPFYGAVILERFIETKDDIFCKKNLNTCIVSIVCLGSGFIGFVVSKIAQRGVVTVYENMYKDIQMWQSWVWDFEDRIRCMLVVAVGEIDSNVAMESFTGIRIMYMALFGFVIMIVPTIAVVSYKKMQNKVMRIFMVSYYILLVSSMFIYDFSMARGTAHRLVGLYMTAVIATVVYMAWLIKDKKLCRYGAVLALLLSGAALFSAYSLVALRGENRYDKLTRVLEENNLSYGYAEYWSAQVTTVLSDSRITVCPINISEEGDVEPRLYNIRAQQFNDQPGVDRYFAFLSSWEYETTKDKIGKEAVDVIQFDDDGYILVFDHNIF